MSKKKFGAFGPQSFKSRSLKAFQTELEQGKAGHLMPVLNAKEKLKKGQDEILAIRNFGQKSLDELMERLEEKGYLDMVQEEPSNLTEILTEFAE